MNDDPSFDALIRDALDASRAQRSDAALALFAEAMTLRPTSELPHWLMAAEYAARGQVDQAEAAFAQALLLAPDFAMARYQLGLLQFSVGRSAAALLTWQPLLALPHTVALPHFVRGFTALAQDNAATALTHLHAGLACENLPPPLAADIRKVVDTLEQRSFGQGEAPAATHVLLAGYSQVLH